MENNNLQHYGIPGMKWGVRRSKTGYRSRGLRAAKARRENDKVDQSFRDWDTKAKNKNAAIELGKKATLARRQYEDNPSNKELKSQYKTANKEYKKALKNATTYHKGVVRQEVGRDAARKYLSDAKKLKKQMDKNPSDKSLQKKYNKLMSAYDIERATARRAASVGAKRSAKKASMKRRMNTTVKVAAGTATVAAGVYATNKILAKRGINGISTQTVRNIAGMAAKGRDFMGYFY